WRACRRFGRRSARRLRCAGGHRSWRHPRDGEGCAWRARGGTRVRTGADWIASGSSNGDRRMTAELRPRWFVAHTHPHAEGKATAHLNRQGFEIYFPRYLKRRRHARRIESITAPLFPRYLFVAIDVNVQRWRSIYSTVGVSRLVCN